MFSCVSPHMLDLRNFQWVRVNNQNIVVYVLRSQLSLPRHTWQKQELLRVQMNQALLIVYEFS